MEHHLEAAKEWARDSSNLRVHARGSKSAAACVQVAAELPLPPREAFELMSHPDNAAIFRGIERCTFRRVLWAAAGDGRQTVEVENESGELGCGCWAAAVARDGMGGLLKAQGACCGLGRGAVLANPLPGGELMHNGCRHMCACMHVRGQRCCLWPLAGVPSLFRMLCSGRLEWGPGCTCACRPNPGRTLGHPMT